MFTAFYIPHIILIESKQRLYPTKWKTRFASCLDGPCLKLYAISVDQHNCQQMDSTFVAVADFPYFCHSLKSVEAGNLFNGKAPNLWSFISFSQTRSDINICQIFLLVCLFICCVRMIDIFGLSNEFSDILQATDVKVFFCLLRLFVCLFKWLKLDCLYFVVFEWLISLVFEIFQY